MPTKSSSCPHCGLVLLIKPDKTKTRLAFDVEDNARAFLMSRSVPLSAAVLSATVVG